VYFRKNRSEHSEPPERLLDRRYLFRRARILYGCGSRCYEAELLFAVQNPGAFGHEAMLSRDPFLDFLIRGALTGWLILAGMMRRAFTSSIVVADAHESLHPD
jgi:hypothetical protein